jgi:hypothetical protein
VILQRYNIKIFKNCDKFSLKLLNTINYIDDMYYIENNTWVHGNTRFISSVEHDISRVSAANVFIKTGPCSEKQILNEIYSILSTN